ncbi:hypothetical protein B0J17DRAFT_433476 [Rhizoctonia solani]|nr:hypothetical protein B0J17DRAFT_433476 [Rhizoctonia solani]
MYQMVFIKLCHFSLSQNEPLVSPTFLISNSTTSVYTLPLVSNVFWHDYGVWAMEPIIADNNVANISNSDTSIAELEKFIEAQRNALCGIQSETKSLEELKRQAIAQPDVVFRDIITGRHGTSKFSNAAFGLAVTAPEIDWTLLEANDLRSATHPRPPEASSSRAGKMRNSISDLRLALARLPPLPAELVDNDEDTEERGKKRRRVDPAHRLPTAPASSSLRLPHPADSYNSVKSQSSAVFSQSLGHPSTSSSSTAGGLNSTKPPHARAQPSMDNANSHRRAWASKGANADTPARHKSSSPISPMSQDTPSTPTQPVENSPLVFATEPATELPDAGHTPTTFKQNWTLAEQHTLERLLVEIPSTVKFRWVRISEAMGGTRTPRQVASRVQKYYEKMKKLGVAVNSDDMGGGGRGGSRATQALDTPLSMRTRTPSTRGKPKTGPQYTKSGRRR